MEPDKQATVLYDGECNLCRGAVSFIGERDRADRFRFVPLEEAEACDTMYLLDEEGRHDRSTAALRVAADLPWPWSLLRFFRFVPRPLRDACYDFVARNRRRWFGRAPRPHQS